MYPPPFLMKFLTRSAPFVPRERFIAGELPPGITSMSSLSSAPEQIDSLSTSVSSSSGLAFTRRIHSIAPPPLSPLLTYTPVLTGFTPPTATAVLDASGAAALGDVQPATTTTAAAKVNATQLMFFFICNFLLIAPEMAR